LDWAILGIGVLAFIFSFFDWYSFSEGGFSVSENAWHGFFGWFAALCAIAGAALVALALFMPQFKMPVANRLAGLGLFALATVCMILAIFITPSYNGIDVPSGVDKGRDFGFWVSLILVIAGLVLSLMRLQQTGGTLPGALANLPNIGARGPQGGIPGGQPQYPPHGGQAQYPPQSQPQYPPQGGPGAPPPPGYNPPQPPPPPGYGPPR
jgi:hypothetical protein